MKSRLIQPEHRNLMIGGVIAACAPIFAAATVTGPVALWVGIACLIAFLIPVLFTIWAILESFTRRQPARMLVTVVLCYWSLTCVFTGIYYSIAYVTDYNSALIKTRYYLYEAHVRNLGTPVELYDLDNSAFTGVSAKLWTGIGDDRRPLDQQWAIPDRSDNTNLDKLTHEAAAVSSNIKRGVKFQPDAPSYVLFDCFHLSVTTMTTVGYGDVSPHSTAARLATDFQAMSGVTLFVLSLGMVFSRWWETPSVENRNEPKEK